MNSITNKQLEKTVNEIFGWVIVLIAGFIIAYCLFITMWIMVGIVNDGNMILCKEQLLHPIKFSFGLE